MVSGSKLNECTSWFEKKNCISTTNIVNFTMKIDKISILKLRVRIIFKLVMLEFGQLTVFIVTCVIFHPNHVVFSLIYLKSVFLLNLGITTVLKNYT